MINMDSIYRTVKAETHGEFKVIEFECENCGQRHENDDLHLAVFLHGIFFLFGKDINYAGFTCLCCSHTMLMKGDQAAVDFMKDTLSAFMFQGKAYFDTSLSYFSSIHHSPKKVPLLKHFSIPSWESRLSHDDAESIDMQLAVYLEKNPWLGEKYLCSYLPGWGKPIGSFFSARWFMDKDISKLMEIENGDSMTKVFPRYVHPMSISKDIEQLCWDYKLSEAFLHATIRDLGAVPVAIPNPELSAAADFLNVLIAEPPQWVFPDRASEDYCRDQILNKFSTEALLKDFHYAEIKKFVLHHSERDYTNRFLQKQYPHFIEKYIDLASRKDISYASVWAVRRDYLNRLYNHIKEESLSESQYAFFEEHPTWTIILKGHPYRGLRSSGFKYIHHLVKNKFKIFSPSELWDLYGTPGSDQLQHSAQKEGLSEAQSDEYPLMDRPYIRELKKRLSDLHEEIAEAEEMNDIGRKESAIAEYELLLSHLRREVDKDGQSREFSNNPSTRKMKSVAKGIERSLKAMKERDAELYRHFHQSLKPIESPIMAYHPTMDINWRTE